MSTVALRTALIWRDEVMEDVVSHKPAKITLGQSGRTTFTVPNTGGLPKNFAIVRPGNRGYLLTLGERMRGTICIDGEQKDVKEFVRRGEGESAGGFCATPISGKDWGVVDLDESGDYKLFFQFVPVEDAQPFFSKPVIYAGFGGWLLSSIVLAIIFWAKGVETDFLLANSELLAELFDELSIDHVNEVLAKNVPLETLEFFTSYAESFARAEKVEGPLAGRLPNLLLIGVGFLLLKRVVRY